MRGINLIGKRFGRLVVFKRSNSRMVTGEIMWLCLCDCGNTHEVGSPCLRQGVTQSCGCLKRNFTLPRKQQKRRSIEEFASDFWKNVDKTETCWIWTKSKNNKGYGCTVRHNGKRAYAHRVSFELAFEEPKLFVLHKCDTPACVRPDHLFEGTQKANMRDCIEKGRFRAGENSNPNIGEDCHNAKLTADKVREIRLLYKSGNSLSQIAKKFGVSAGTIHPVIHHKTWKHVI